MIHSKISVLGFGWNGWDICPEVIGVVETLRSYPFIYVVCIPFEIEVKDGYSCQKKY